ncbi:MAG: hypothetical protein K8R21_07400, partial [Leptospira sp.]|nr:hypothetical protein [Leptospira sp.]
MKQGKLATSLFVGLSLLSSVAFAGGLSNEEDILVVENEPYDWTGYYAGLNAGIVKHTLSMTDNNASSFNATIQEVANPKFTGGFQLGYRYQMDPDHTSAVYGAEFSANFSNATFSKTYGSPFALYQLNAENQ